MGEDYIDQLLASGRDLEDLAGIVRDERDHKAPVNAPADSPASASFDPLNPAGFDWTNQGVQNIGGVIYAPSYSGSVGSVEQGTYEPGALQGVMRYKEGQTAPGQTYEILDPETGKVVGTGQFQEQSHGFFGDLWDMVSTAATDLGPILQATPFGPAVAAVNAVNAARTGDVLPLIASAAGYGGYTDVANAAKAASAIRNQDYLGAIVPGMAAAGVSNVGGYTPKDIGTALNVARAIKKEDPTALLSAVSAYLPKPSASKAPKSNISQDPSAGYGGADQGYFDPDAETSPLPDWALDPYGSEPEFLPASEVIRERQSLEDRFPAPEGQTGYDLSPKTSMSPQEMSRFLEANIDDPGTIDMLMQEYYPELYRQSYSVTGTKEDTGFTPSRSIRDIGTVTQVQPGEKLEGTEIKEPDLSQNLPKVTGPSTKSGGGTKKTTTSEPSDSTQYVPRTPGQPTVHTPILANVNAFDPESFFQLAADQGMSQEELMQILRG